MVPEGKTGARQSRVLAAAADTVLHRDEAPVQQLHEARWELGADIAADLADRLEALVPLLRRAAACPAAPGADDDAEAGRQVARARMRERLVAYAAVTAGRDELLGQAVGVGLSEVETARLSGLARGTVRKAVEGVRAARSGSVPAGRRDQHLVPAGGVRTGAAVWPLSAADGQHRGDGAAQRVSSAAPACALAGDGEAGIGELVAPDDRKAGSAGNGPRGSAELVSPLPTARWVRFQEPQFDHRPRQPAGVLEGEPDIWAAAVARFRRATTGLGTWIGE